MSASTSMNREDTGAGQTIPGHSWADVDGQWLGARAQAVGATALAQGALCPMPTDLLMLPKAAGAEVRRLLRRRPRGSSERRSQANPFLPPDQRLVLRAWGPAHTLLLNKYPIRPGHLLLITNGDQPQSGWLSSQDWQAAAALLERQDGLLFFNSGPVAGASQPHRHLQLLPRLPGRPCFPWEPWINQPNGVYPWRLRKTSLLRRDGDLAATMDRLYGQQLASLGLGSAREHGQPQGAYNLLITADWFITVPRRREEHQGVNINALGFAGMVLVTDQTSPAWLAAGGDVLSVLQAVGEEPSLTLQQRIPDSVVPPAC
ncbi:MAG: ATP adenylyltransferase [Synechococcus sp. SB0662_bin_45]|nr:DUF4922 domain-containing protein [Cyanobacteria bacterium MAG IRC3_bin_20]MDE0646687.1 DUF4922 domain-containing protein [Cyanobacteria bacterium MAG IRC4_bin_6]MXW12849.1 ATP adenylyltransferase [Synechococcus sp. SB0668_bin_13]MYE20891.1 ATP adenylyltransferase [Synechococcus sp. SB0662_bin_45]MYG63635.1 ATP adenylyltransferase [Synechococcus sp. SB0675_bin_7]